MRFFNRRHVIGTPFEGIARNTRTKQSITARTLGIRGAARRNRVLVVTLLIVGGLVAGLAGVSMAQGGWFIVNPLETPPPRFGAATAWDAVNDEMVVFGGFGTNVGNGLGFGNFIQPQVSVVNRGDTRAYKYATKKWFDRNPIHAPSPRGYAAMAYDGARKNIVLFGGTPYRANAPSGETWTWDGKDWTLMNPPEPRPEPRHNHVMTYDAHRKVVVMFGGQGLSGTQVVTLNDTWTWDGTRWKIMPSAGAPAPRHSAAMAYDSCNAQAVMFGGVGGGLKLAPEARETWTWDGEKWTPRNPLVAPPARIGASMAYSSRTGRVLMYGGLTTDDVGVSSVAADPDVWRWDGAGGTWERTNSDVLMPAGWVTTLAGQAFVNLLPPPRAYASFAGRHVDEDDGFNPRFSLFGGTSTLDAANPDTRNNVVPQAAFGDHFLFSEQGYLVLISNTDEPVPFVGNTPLTRRCANPVPIPSDDVLVGGPQTSEAPKVETREGMREIGQLPVLLGTDWPQDQRDKTVFAGYAGGYNRYNPNPKYTPPPECPNYPEGDTGSNTNLVTDPTRNRVYMFFNCDYRRGRNGDTQLPYVYNVSIEVYHGTTLEPLGSSAITLKAPLVTRDIVHDPSRGQFLLWSTNNELTVVRQESIEKGTDPVVRKIPLAGTIAMMSFFDHPKTGSPKLLINRGGTSLSQVDLETNTVDYSATTTGCTSIGSPQFGSSMRPMRSGDLIYVACSGTVGGTNRAGVVRMPIIQNPDGSETPGAAEVFPGPPSVVANWNDPEAERMVLMSGGAGSRLYVWVFDGKASRYVGFAGIKQVTYNFGYRFTFDPKVGRLYVLTSDAQNIEGGRRVRDQGGVRILDTRLTPVSQALNFPQFAAVPGSGWDQVSATLPGEPGVPRRVFMRRGEGTMKKYPDGETVNMPNEMFYRVLADEVPVPDNTELSDLDALTIGVVENSQKTEVTFDAEGGAYGIRLRSIGGIKSAARPPQQMPDFVGPLLLGDGVRPFVPACIFPDRELMAGFIPQARLSDLDALARSTGLEVDSNSKTDLEAPFSRCQPTANASQFPPSIKLVFDALWPLWQMVQFEGNQEVGPHMAWDEHFKTVECVGDALNTYRAEVGNVYGSSNCVKKEGLVEATAQGSATGAGTLAEAASDSGFSVAEGYSKVKVERDPVKGVVVTSVAVARGVQLPGLSVDRVTTEAVAWSNGRPDEDNKRASFRREICGVVTPDYSNSKCLSSGEQKQLVDGWNSRWGINSKMYLPTPDPELLEGSPGGYIVGVIKPQADEIEDQLFAKDFQREVPGLVIDFYKDSGEFERQSLQLAATRAVAGFGVQCNADHIFSPEKKDCLPLTFDDDFSGDDFFEEDEEFFEEGEEAIPATEGYWLAAPTAASPQSLGNRIGNFISGLPVLGSVPVRQVGEALLLSSVWLLLAAPLVLAYRRLSVW